MQGRSADDDKAPVELLDADAGSVPDSGEEGERSDKVADADVAGIRQALHAILASADFAASGRARRFLEYVVEETLGGRANRIKAFSVAVEVFGRTETFDPQNDPVVRIEAGRLRRALEHYYLLSGKDDPLVIEIPKGGYVPSFRRRTPTAVSGTREAPDPNPPRPDEPRRIDRHRRPPGRVLVLLLAIAGVVAWLVMGSPPFGTESVATGPSHPRVLVVPFAALGDDQDSVLYSSVITEEVIIALGRFREIVVVGGQSSRGETRGIPDADYIVEGSARRLGDAMRVTARLTYRGSDAVLWSQTYENATGRDEFLAVPAETAGAIAAAIAQPYGAVFQSEASRAGQTPAGHPGADLCMLRYYAYRAVITPENYAAARDCLERTVASFPQHATAWALLAHIYIDEIRTGFAHGADVPAADRALDAARTAVRLDPNNARALQALAVALFYDHQVDEAFKVSERAIAANPYDPDLLGQLGQLMGLAGRTDDGRALIERALVLNPENSPFYRGVLSIIAYMQGDFATARHEIESIDMDSLPIFHGVAAIAYAQSGDMEKGKAELETFNRMAPDFIPNLWHELDRRNIPVASQAAIADGLAKLGANIPPRSAAASTAAETAGGQ